MIRFSKYHGCGNSFVIVREKDVAGKDFSTLAEKMCCEQTGIGADGFIVVRTEPELEKLTINVDVLGTDRANACGKRAVKMAEEGKLNTVKPSSYDGSVPLEKMGPMTLEEKAAYLEARTIYLETLVEAKKKWLSELLGKPVSSIRVKD